MQSLFEQNLTNAFEDAVGPAGASQERYQHWLDKLTQALPRIMGKPVREAAPVFGLPSKVDDLKEIGEIAKDIADRFSTLVVVGMGGSSLSAETLGNIYGAARLKLLFLDNIDPQTMDVMLQGLEWRATAMLVISKSGNTVETLALMAILLRRAKAALGDVSKHFFVITVLNDNPLHAIAKAEGMRVVAHDPDLGGRFSILSSVGLIPAAAIGMDIRKLRAGAAGVLEKPEAAVQSAALHLALMDKKVRINVMMHYGDRLSALANWYRQCWAESLGKCERATTPIRSRGATDQHSQLQLYLDGPKDKLFSLMMVESQGQGESIEFSGNSDARLAFLKDRTLGDLIAAEQKGTLATLIKRGCPVRSLTMKVVNEEVVGALLMHFLLEVIFAAELLGVDAFDQPAVEESKIQALRVLAT